MTLPSPFFQEIATPTQVTEQQNKIQPKHPQEPVKRNFNSFCKYCQVGFSNDTELFQHRRSHAKCPFDECKFNANEPTIAAHIQRVHIKQNTSVKIQDLTTPEQIEKWKEERRKRYPTTQNIILRQQIQEERHKRGEKLQDSKKRFGDNQQRNFVKNMGNRQHNNNNQGNIHNKHDRNKRKQRQSNHRKRNSDKIEITSSHEIEPDKSLNAQTIENSSNRTVRDNNVQKFNKQEPLKVYENDSSDEDLPKVPKFQGTSKMKNYHTVETVVKEKPALSLLGMYGSNSEDSCSDNDDEIAPEINESATDHQCAEKMTIEINEKRQDVAEMDEAQENEDIENIDNDEDDDGPEEIKTVKETTEQSDENPLHRSRKRKRANGKPQELSRPKAVRRSGLDYSKLKNRSVNPFLEKLLSRDIVHERNVLLQCVNYVVKNKFFEISLDQDKEESHPN